jgi:hypothetical protein
MKSIYPTPEETQSTLSRITAERKGWQGTRANREANKTDIGDVIARKQKEAEDLFKKQRSELLGSASKLRSEEAQRDAQFKMERDIFAPRGPSGNILYSSFNKMIPAAQGGLEGGATGPMAEVMAFRKKLGYSEPEPEMNSQQKQRMDIEKRISQLQSTQFASGDSAKSMQIGDQIRKLKDQLSYI